MGFREELLEHLAEYRVNQLGVDEVGEYHGRPYRHILPKSRGDMNLSMPIRNRCVAYLAERGIRRHRNFHHLNSSQAYALNLFFPLLDGGETSHRVLLDALGVEGQVESWRFEAVPDPREGTNFDLLLFLRDGRRLYCEVKLTESGFGGARANAARRTKLQKHYGPRLRGLVPPDWLEESSFFRRYQLLRVLSYMDEPPGSEVLLLFPAANRHALQQATETVEGVGAKARGRLRIIDSTQLITRALEDPRLPETAREALALVRLKYRVGASAFP